MIEQISINLNKLMRSWDNKLIIKKKMKLKDVLMKQLLV